MQAAIVLSVLVSAAVGQYAPAPAYAAAPVYADEPAVYAYQYGVADDYSGAQFNQQENRDGYATTGSYSVALPDGRTQTVNYHTNGDSGNIAEVTYSGVPTYGPGPAAHGPAHVVAHRPVLVHAPVLHAAAPLVHAGIAHGPLLAHGPARLAARPFLG